MTSRRLVVALLILGLAAIPALAAPNLSGTFKLNVSKSDFGQAPPPNSMTRTVTHAEPKLKVVTRQSSDMGDSEFEANYTTDGKECTNVMRGNPIKSTVKWDGDTLLVNSKSSYNGNDITITDKWSLSADGKTLTILRHFASSMGEMDTKLVLEKQ